MDQTLSEEGRTFIEGAAVLRHSPYICDERFVRIGYEHLVWSKGEPLSGPEGLEAANRIFRHPITHQSAAHILQTDIMMAEVIVRRYVTRRISQMQYDALVSLVTSIGRGANGIGDGFVETKRGGPSRVLSYVNEGEFGKAADEFLVWVPSSGISRPRLVTRRQMERAAFLLDEGRKQCAA